MQFRSRVKKSSSKHAGLFSLFSEINTDQPLPLFHNKLLLIIKNYEDENKMLVKQAALCKHEYETLSAKRLELMSEHKIQKIQIKGLRNELEVLRRNTTGKNHPFFNFDNNYRNATPRSRSIRSSKRKINIPVKKKSILF